jgi:uncharacterized lipoprotein YajG
MRSLIVIMLCACVSACAYSVDRIDLPYEGRAGGPPVSGAAAVTVQVSSADARTTYKDRVGSKINGFGMEAAAIVATNDVVATVGKAIEQELTARGFAIGSGGAKLAVRVTRFYNQFKQGILSGDAVAEINLDVKLLAPDGTVVFSNTYYGSGREPNIQLASGSNAKLALTSAMNDSVRQVVTDEDLIDALLHGRRPAGISSTGTPTS